MRNSSLKNHILLVICFFLSVGFTDCNKNKSKTDPPGNGGGNTNPPISSDVSFYLTKGDQSALLQKQTYPIQFKDGSNSNPDIIIDSTQSFQSIDGFGFTLTDGSAQLIMGLPDGIRKSVLNELFGNDSNSISISYLRLSLGASDLSSSVYTYDDMPANSTDKDLIHFDLRKDLSMVIPALKEILAINPGIKLLSSPWTAPVWMKDNQNSVGGSLLPQYYGVYANYFVKYIQAMKNEGITIDAITPQNEPLHGGNNPSMVMQATEEAAFIKNNLGPALRNAGLSTKIIIWDHNADNPQYPISILNDQDARQYIDGAAFHLYGGDISALSTVHNAYPNKNLYFTEQYTSSGGAFAGDLTWHTKNVIIGSTRNWSRIALEWNLASDPNYSIHTQGGCTTCKGGITIVSGMVRNVGYYIIGHASKFVPAGSVRISSNIAGNIYNVAFLRPDGKKVLIAVNEGNISQSFNINFKNKRASVSLDAGAVGTFIW